MTAMPIVLSGSVIRGDHRGRRLGFRTANLRLQERMQAGIYAGRAEVAGRAYPAAIYVARAEHILEAHLVGFKGNLYGKHIRVQVDKKIREVYDFKTEGELIRAIQEDVRAAREEYTTPMFTGIISHLAKVERVAHSGGALFVWFIPTPNGASSRFWMAKPSRSVTERGFKASRGLKLRSGASVSVNGICSTVHSNRKGMLEVHYMSETLKRTTASGFRKGTFLNLETSLRLTSFIDGHIVQGHIDFVGTVRNVLKSRGQTVLTILTPAKYREFFVEKGSVAVDGVSLTVSGIGKHSFEVSLIDYTLAHTTLGLLERGSKVNIETDILGKYILNK